MQSSLRQVRMDVVSRTDLEGPDLINGRFVPHAVERQDATLRIQRRDGGA